MPENEKPTIPEYVTVAQIPGGPTTRPGLPVQVRPLNEQERNREETKWQQLTDGAMQSLP